MQSDSQEGTMSGIKYPARNDVICGRGGHSTTHSGNVQFRLLIDQFKSRYQQSNKAERVQLATEIVQAWRQQNPPGRFLQRSDPSLGDESLWEDIGDAKAIKKALNTLRQQTPTNEFLAAMRKQSHSTSSSTSSRPATSVTDTERPQVQQQLQPPSLQPYTTLQVHNHVQDNPQSTAPQLGQHDPPSHNLSLQANSYVQQQTDMREIVQDTLQFAPNKEMYEPLPQQPFVETNGQLEHRPSSLSSELADYWFNSTQSNPLQDLQHSIHLPVPPQQEGLQAPPQPQPQPQLQRQHQGGPSPEEINLTLSNQRAANITPSSNLGEQIPTARQLTKGAFTDDERGSSSDSMESARS